MIGLCTTQLRACKKQRWQENTTPPMQCMLAQQAVNDVWHSCHAPPTEHLQVLCTEERSRLHIKHQLLVCRLFMRQRMCYIWRQSNARQEPAQVEADDIGPVQRPDRSDTITADVATSAWIAISGMSAAMQRRPPAMVSRRWRLTQQHNAK